MKLTQRTALTMFLERGFDAVTVGEIATEVGMAASTLYRHFETKEAIVLWDEHEAALDSAFARELSRQPPFAAMRTVLVEELGGRYDADVEFQLKRVRYIYETEQLHAAAVEADLADREELTEALTHVLSNGNHGAAPVLAGAALLAVDVALDAWQKGNGTITLGAALTDAFDQLAHLDALT